MKFSTNAMHRLLKHLFLRHRFLARAILPPPPPPTKIRAVWRGIFALAIFGITFAGGNAAFAQTDSITLHQPTANEIGHEWVVLRWTAGVSGGFIPQYILGNGTPLALSSNFVTSPFIVSKTLVTELSASLSQAFVPGSSHTFNILPESTLVEQSNSITITLESATRSAILTAAVQPNGNVDLAWEMRGDYNCAAGNEASPIVERFAIVDGAVYDPGYVVLYEHPVPTDECLNPPGSATNPNVFTYTDTTAAPGQTYAYRILATGFCQRNPAGECDPLLRAESNLTPHLTIPARPATAAVTDKHKLILPEVLRQIPAGISRAIFQRIQERQRQDGKWK